jgi:K+:H+ antiporter
MNTTVHGSPLALAISQRHAGRAAAAYAAMIAGAVALFWLLRTYGEALSAPAANLSAGGVTATAASTAGNTFGHVLIALTAVILVGRLLGLLCVRIHQPPVIGEVIAGVLLGPSLLGAVSPEAYQFILPPSVAPLLGIIAQLGIVLYMFLVGLDLNPDLMRAQVHATIATSHASIIVPFLLGSALALFLYPRFSTADVSFTSFALFLGIAMSITAFPVLARILSDLRMTRTELGTIALTCAAVDDVTAWCLLALVVGVVKADGSQVVQAITLTLAFIVCMFGVVRPTIERWSRALGDAEPTQNQIALAMIGLLIASLTTEAIGIHALFGAFLFGAVIPHDSRFAQVLTTNLQSIVTVLLLPAFFALAGMRTQIGLLSGAGSWMACGLIILVATLGKFGGTFVAARIGGLGWRPATALGVLMNTRGLMQLIVLNVGLDLGVITPTVFTMMVLMALLTTLATSPILNRLMPA